MKMNLRNVTIEIKGFGGMKNDLLYTQVLWVSSNRKWVLYKNEDDRMLLEDVVTGEGQFPIIYDDGHVVYDNPCIVPNYVKENVSRCLRKYNNIK